MSDSSTFQKNLDVFISYSHCDKTVADSMCSYLEGEENLHCWYAPRDIAPGDSWADAIMTAIERARYFVIIFSENSSRSKQVLNEITNAFDSDCIIIPFKISETALRGGMSYYLKGKHWLDAITPPLVDRYAELADNIKHGLGKETTREAAWNRKAYQGPKQVNIPVYTTSFSRAESRPLFDIFSRLVTPVAAVETLEADEQIEESHLREIQGRRLRHRGLIMLLLSIILWIYCCFFQIPDTLSASMTIDDIGLIWGPFRQYLADYSNFADSVYLYSGLIILYPIVLGVIMSFALAFLVNNLYYKPRERRIRKKVRSKIESLEHQKKQIAKSISPYICYVPMDCRTSERIVSMVSDFNNHMADNLTEAVQSCEYNNLQAPSAECLREIPCQLVIGDMTTVLHSRDKMSQDEAFTQANNLAEKIVFSE